jgi:hypothetical protein
MECHGFLESFTAESGALAMLGRPAVEAFAEVTATVSLSDPGFFLLRERS